MRCARMQWPLELGTTAYYIQHCAAHLIPCPGLTTSRKHDGSRRNRFPGTTEDLLAPNDTHDTLSLRVLTRFGQSQSVTSSMGWRRSRS